MPRRPAEGAFIRAGAAACLAALAVPCPAPEPALAQGLQPPVPLSSIPLPVQSVALPFSASAEVALLRRGGSWMLVVDQVLRADPGWLAQAPFIGQASIRRLPDATVFLFALPDGQIPVLRHDDDVWTLQPVAEAKAASSLPEVVTVSARAGMLGIPAGPGGHVVMVPDPATGAVLAVGTMSAPGRRTARARRFAEFSLVPTLFGIAMDPIADTVVLAPDPAGFTVSASPGTSLQLSNAINLTGAPDVDVAGLTRSFDIPGGDPPALLRRLHAQILDTVRAPLLARLPYRRQVAGTLLALGMGAEAAGELTLASEDDPAALTDPETQHIAGAAALIAGRPREASGLTVPDAGNSDEYRLWRALHDAALLAEDDAVPRDTAQTLAAYGGLLLSYPPGLRRCVLPLAVETLLRAGDLADAQALLDAAPDLPELRYARARALDLAGQVQPALDAYDALIRSNDRSQSARAAVASLELQVARHILSPAAAADRADALIDAWRGDARERDLRLRIADWRGQAGAYRQQLEALRGALANFPAPEDGVRQKLDDAFAAITARLVAPNDGSIAPLELVALIEENQDLIPDGPTGRALVGAMADRLQALDLPDQAATLLQSLLATATDPDMRATLATRLAALQQQTGQNQQALQTLASSDTTVSGLKPDQQATRALTEARADVALGRPAQADAALGTLGTDQALIQRADIAEQSNDLRDAAADLGTALADTAPATGPLDPSASALALRLASAVAQLGDTEALAKLRATYDGRFPNSSDAALFALLTAPPVETASDLPRAATESHVAKAILRGLGRN
jgi:hypothetical protein